MSNNSSSAGLFGCLFPSFGMVGMLFLVLKLAQIGLPTDWSWWFVLLPFYILPLGFLIFIICLFGGVWFLDRLQSIARWNRNRKQAARVKKNDAEIEARVAKNDAFLRGAEAELKRRGHHNG